MKYLRFFLVTSINIALIWSLNTRFGSVPPLGKFLDPAHGFWQNAEQKAAYAHETFVLKALSDKVTVKYDSLLVPHIFAANDHDLYFMQGYVTAQHRLWQMEFQTHAAAGRLSEIIGKQGLSYDRSQRRKGLGTGAENFLRTIESNAQTLEAVSAYAEGVNEYIQQLSPSELPIEYKLLDYRPEPWTPIKSAYLLKYMANDLSYGDEDLRNTNGLLTFGEALFDILYPNMLPQQDPVVSKPNEWGFEAFSTPAPPTPFAIEAVNTTLIEAPNPENGSNNWAVAGSKTANGHPILCNDPHLGLNLPSIWFAVQLGTPQGRAKGVSLPGSPCIITGFTDSIAWGVTNARRDVVDWYNIQFKDENMNEYLLDSNWVQTMKRVEEIKLRGEDTFLDTVYYTQWGPVVYDKAFRPDHKQKHYALQWVAHEPSDELMTFYLLNRAKNYHDYQEALNYFSCPAQNIAFASTSGDIAIRVQGKFPIKWENQGKYLMDGTSTANRWKGYIPPNHLVADLNPARGFISSANQHPADSTYPYFVYDRSFEYYRNRRINQVLDSLENITVEDMQVFQNDNYNLMAAEALPLLFQYASKQTDISGKQQEALSILQSWDFYNDPEKIAPAYFEAWIDALMPLVWDEIRNHELTLKTPHIFNTIHLLKTQPQFSFFDVQSTEQEEDAEAVIIMAFEKALQHIDEWKAENKDGLNWWRYKNTSLNHLARLPAFSIKNIQNGGNHNIVNATSERWGPSWRMITELDPEGVKTWASYPGGQSGNPGSFFYSNLVETWSLGKYHRFDMMQVDDSHAYVEQSYAPAP